MTWSETRAGVGADERFDEIKDKLLVTINELREAGFKKEEVAAVLFFFGCSLAKLDGASKGAIRVCFEMMWAKADGTFVDGGVEGRN